MRFRLLVLPLLILLKLTSLAQVHDSLVKESDSTLSVHQQVTKAFQSWKDSVDAVHIKEEVKRNGKSLDAFLQEMHEKEEASKRQTYVRIGLVATFLIVMAVGLLRKQKNT